MVFDVIMNLVDANCKMAYSEFSKKLYIETGYTDMDMTKAIVLLTDGRKTFRQYFRERKLFYAVKELVDFPDMSIVDIALDYDYSEQSAFSRAVKAFYGKTPREIRKYRMRFPDERLSYNDVSENKTMLEKIIEPYMTIDGLIFDTSLQEDYFWSFIRATEELGFDTATCHAISEISERLDIPFGILLEHCFELYVECREWEKDDHYLPPKVETAIELDIKSDEDFDKICEHYGCEWYELTRIMVDRYYGRPCLFLDE